MLQATTQGLRSRKWPYFSNMQPQEGQKIDPMG